MSTQNRPVEIPLLPKLKGEHPILGIYDPDNIRLSPKAGFYTVRIRAVSSTCGFVRYVGMYIYFRTSEIRRKSTWRLKYEDHKEFHVCSGIHTHRR